MSAFRVNKKEDQLMGRLQNPDPGTTDNKWGLFCQMKLVSHIFKRLSASLVSLGGMDEL